MIRVEYTIGEDGVFGGAIDYPGVEGASDLNLIAATAMQLGFESTTHQRPDVQGQPVTFTVRRWA